MEQNNILILVEEAIRGDLNSFEKLVDRYKKKVHFIAYQMTGNRSDADDISQETFIKAYRALGTFNGKSNFYTWLYRILINCCFDNLRKRKKLGYAAEDLLEIEANQEDVKHLYLPVSPLKEAESGELRRAVSEGINSLPAKHRMVLVLHEFEGMPHQEIAAAMGCSEGTVRSRLHYARMKMKEKLRDFVS